MPEKPPMDASAILQSPSRSTVAVVPYCHPTFGSRFSKKGEESTYRTIYIFFISIIRIS